MTDSKRGQSRHHEKRTQFLDVLAMLIAKYHLHQPHHRNPFPANVSRKRNRPKTETLEKC